MNPFSPDNTHLSISNRCDDQIEVFLQNNFNEKVKFVLVCDKNTQSNCLEKVLKSTPRLNSAFIICLEAGEKQKTLSTVEYIWKELHLQSFSRSDVLINLGGGVISDLGGFVASTYKRGMRYINIPTTLIGQCDAAIGGKTAFDFNGVKNLIGTFHQPTANFIFTEFLQTLPLQHIQSGLAEILKMALICNKEKWVSLSKLKVSEISDWTEWLRFSVQAKTQITEIDPFDKRERKILNFGHTLGHAIEAYSLEYEKRTLLHGEAVAIGMLGEAKLSADRNFITHEELLDIQQCILANFEVPPFLINTADLIKLMSADKKNTSPEIQCVLLGGIGNAIIDVKIQNEEMIAAIDWLIGFCK